MEGSGGARDLGSRGRLFLVQRLWWGCLFHVRLRHGLQWNFSCSCDSVSHGGLAPFACPSPTTQVFLRYCRFLRPVTKGFWFLETRLASQQQHTDSQAGVCGCHVTRVTLEATVQNLQMDFYLPLSKWTQIILPEARLHLPLITVG